MFHFDQVHVGSHWPVSSRFRCGGSLVVINGSVMLGAINGNVYRLDEQRDKWDFVTEVKVIWATLGVCEGKLIAVGGMKEKEYSMEVMVLEGKKWTRMSEMPFGCAPLRVCVVSVGECDLLVMGGRLVERYKGILVFNGKTKTWHTGPRLPCPDYDFVHVSAVVHEDLLFAALSIDEHASVWYAKISDLVSNLLHS